jgi:spoIIIJ-associated protein
MREIERSAASVEEAIEAALDELGVTEQEAQIEIVQEPRSGLLGLNQRPAIVRVSAGAPVQEESVDLDQQVDVAAAFLTGLFDTMGIDADVEAAEVDGTTYVDVWGPETAEEMGVLIGKHGHTLDALQELTRSHVQRMTGERCRVQVDVEDYRKRRVSQVARRARDAGHRVLRSGTPEALDPMSAFERKVVHDTIAELGGLETGSEGEEPERRVVIRRAAR